MNLIDYIPRFVLDPLRANIPMSRTHIAKKSSERSDSNPRLFSLENPCTESGMIDDDCLTFFQSVYTVV